MSKLVTPGVVDTVTMQSAATATGNGTAAQTAYSNSSGAFMVLDMQVTGISGDTITFEGTIDGTNWVAVQCENLNSGATGTTATANGLYRFVIGGIRQVRARVSAYSAGSITVTGVMVA